MTSVPTGTARPTPVADEMMPEGEEQPDENGADGNHRGERGASVEVEVGDSDSDGDVEFVTPTNSPLMIVDFAAIYPTSSLPSISSASSDMNAHFNEVHGFVLHPLEEL